MAGQLHKPVARFPGGLTNLDMTAGLGSFLAPSPTKCHVFFEEFNAYDPAEWTVTKTQVGATQALTTGNGGLIALANTSANADQDAISTSSSGDNVVINSAKKHWCRSRFKVNTVANANPYFGVLDVGTGNNYILFQQTAGVLQFKIAAAGVAQVTTNLTQTLTDDTFVTAGWYYDGLSTVYIFVNDTLVASVSTSGITWPSATMNNIISIVNETAAAHTATFDYLFWAQER